MNRNKRTPQACELGIDPREVKGMRKLALRATSLETPVGDEGGDELGDFIQDEGTPDPVDAVAAIMAKEHLGKILNAMDRRERTIVELRFGLQGKTTQSLAELSPQLKVSRERIRQLEVKALEQIRASDHVHVLRGAI